jgi:hypothetical protein
MTLRTRLQPAWDLSTHGALQMVHSTTSMFLTWGKQESHTHVAYSKVTPFPSTSFRMLDLYSMRKLCGACGELDAYLITSYQYSLLRRKGVRYASQLGSFQMC